MATTVYERENCVGGRIPTFDFRYKKFKILPFMATNVGKDGTFPAYSCFSTMDSFRFEEIVREMAHFKSYSSLSEKRHAFVQVKWQISVQPCIIL